MSTLPCMRGPRVSHPAKGEAGEPLGLVGRRPSGPHRLKLPRVTSLLALEGGLRRIGYIPGVGPSYKYKGRGSEYTPPHTTHHIPHTTLTHQHHNIFS